MTPASNAITYSTLDSDHLISGSRNSAITIWKLSEHPPDIQAEKPAGIKKKYKNSNASKSMFTASGEHDVVLMGCQMLLEGTDERSAALDIFKTNEVVEDLVEAERM